MTVSYNLAPNPKWYLVNLTGLPLGGGSIATFSNLNHSIPKPVFKDINGSVAWPNPIPVDANGTVGPLYFEHDTNNPTDTYFYIVYDSSNVEQYSISNFFPPDSTNGGGTSTTANSLKNLIINNAFFHAEPQSALPIALTNYFIAPSNHVGIPFFTGGPLNDIRFIKNNTAANDQLTITPFTTGSMPFSPSDVTPVNYLNYTCNNNPIGELFKYVSYPISSKVQNLSGQTVTISFWARVNSGAPSVSLSIYQYFGDGGAPSSPVTTPILPPITLTNTWVQYFINAIIPIVSGKILGTCGNDATYLQFNYPMSSATSIDHVKMSVYLGTVTPSLQFNTYDEIESQICEFRTGDIRTSINAFAPYGWVAMNDGYIGTPASGGSIPMGAATARLNIDVFPLYDLIWNQVSNTYAPVVGGRGANSVADFTANKPMQITQQLGRALSSIGLASTVGLTTFALGQIAGEEQHLLTILEMPSHNHPSTGHAASGAFVGVSASPDGSFNTGGTGNNSVESTSSFVGGGAAHNIIQPTTYYNMFIKL